MISRVVGSLLRLAAAGGLVLVGLTLLTLSAEEALEAGTGRTGVADVTACRRVGPVSGNGLGHWWTCTVQVEWADGGQGRYDVPGSRFTPADRGRRVAVREIVRGGRGNLTAATRPVRADRPPRIGLLVAGVLAFLAGALCALRPTLGVIRVLLRTARRAVHRPRRG